VFILFCSLGVSVPWRNQEVCEALFQINKQQCKMIACKDVSTLLLNFNEALNGTKAKERRK